MGSILAQSSEQVKGFLGKKINLPIRQRGLIIMMPVEKVNHFLNFLKQWDTPHPL